ncbi:MAG TPA: UPF0175 family protein [Candidatus Thermoplasmatota archaeon]|nr:UPF0175 family protein [Candidatus Thermoplasmatota archaeon]
MDETVSVRLPSDLVRTLTKLADDTQESRSDVVRDALTIGLAAKRLEHALALYRARRVSLGRASKLAELPISVFLDELKRAGVLLNYDLDDLRKDLEWARRT